MTCFTYLKEKCERTRVCVQLARELSAVPRPIEYFPVFALRDYSSSQN